MIADLPKKVEWDQARLARMVERIRAAGDNPADYVEIAINVPERRYAASGRRHRAPAIGAKEEHRHDR